MGEVARKMDDISTLLVRIENKLDGKNDKDDQLRKDTEQDAAIKENATKIDRMLWGIVLLALGVAANLIGDLSYRGIIQ